MGLDFTTLCINRVIIHDVPVPRGGQKASLEPSEIESELTDELKLYLKERITQSATSSWALDVLIDAATSSPVPTWIVDFLSGRIEDFVAYSQQIARHLSQSQTGANSAGLLVVLDCTLSSCPCAVILKLERESGLRVERSNFNGKRTFSMEHIRQLMLTNKTKVFKTAVFVLQSADPVDIKVVVSDNQQGELRQREVADFFLHQFLGCMLAEAPAVTTKRFFETTEAFINEEVQDPITKARYHVALLAEMNSQSSTLNPRAFAGNFIDARDRQTFISYLEARNVPVQVLEKDIEFVSNRVRQTRVAFDSGIALIAPPEVFSDKVRMSPQDNGLTKVELEDRLKSVTGRR